jgi:hypothetical protein
MRKDPKGVRSPRNTTNSFRTLYDEIIETGEDLEGGKVSLSFLHVSQLKIRILIDEFDVGFRDIAFELEGNNVAAISNDISNEQYTAADEMLEELSDITEMDSGSKFLNMYLCSY